jgi:hypothetical protein
MKYIDRFRKTECKIFRFFRINLRDLSPDSFGLSTVKHIDNFGGFYDERTPYIVRVPTVIYFGAFGVSYGELSRHFFGRFIENFVFTLSVV